MIETNSIEKYCNTHTSSHSALLHELERETNLKTLSPQMIAGEYQGRLLSMISKMISPDRILEIGTFTGYSAICLSEGLKENGMLYTIEVNPELKHISNKYFTKRECHSNIKYLEGDALDLIPKLTELFDLIFIDAAKLVYKEYFELVLPILTKGGIILADNVLWSGKVINEIKDKDTKYLDQFNKLILKDPRVENILLPIRDGINIIRKIV